MKPALVDVSVLVLFFNRPTPLAQVFAQIQKARPARLFLYQDGARNEQDIPLMEACREIVSHIDWECEVHRLYQERNFGCDPSEYISQKWAFSQTDKCIVLEDDDVPALSFFQFCKEMLDKYENDPRVWMISGFNHEEVSDVPYDYFFTRFFPFGGGQAGGASSITGTNITVFSTTRSTGNSWQRLSKTANTAAHSSRCANFTANRTRLSMKPSSGRR